MEAVVFERTVKTTIQILYDKRLIDNYNNADEVLEAYLFGKRRNTVLEKVHDVSKRF